MTNFNNQAEQLKWRKYLMGIDIGGTKTGVVLIQVIPTEIVSATTSEKELIFHHNKECYQLKILKRERIPTERDKGYDFVINKISKLILSICEAEKIPWEMISFLGIGVPGSVEPRSQIMQNGNSFIFIGKDLLNDLRGKLPLKSSSGFMMKMENDANCFSLAEAYCGVGPHYFHETSIPIEEQCGLGIILGTGCGGGAVLGGQLLRGRKGGAMEVGHTLLASNNGAICYCGRQGCAEGVISGTGLEESYVKIGKKRLIASEIFEQARIGDFYAQRIIQNYQLYLDQFLANLYNLFDPDYIVLGGGVSKQNKIYEGTEERIKKLIFLTTSHPRLYRHKLGDSGGVIGAALLFFNNT